MAPTRQTYIETKLWDRRTTHSSTHLTATYEWPSSWSTRGAKALKPATHRLVKLEVVGTTKVRIHTLIRIWLTQEVMRNATDWWFLSTHEVRQVATNGHEWMWNKEATIPHHSLSMRTRLIVLINVTRWAPRDGLRINLTVHESIQVAD